MMPHLETTGRTDHRSYAQKMYLEESWRKFWEAEESDNENLMGYWGERVHHYAELSGVPGYRRYRRNTDPRWDLEVAFMEYCFSSPFFDEVEDHARLMIDANMHLLYK